MKTTVQSYFQQLFIVQPTQSNTPLLPLQALRACFPDPIFAARILVPSSDTHWGKHRKAHSERNPLDRLIWIELGPSVPHVFGGIKTRDSSCRCHLRTASERQGSLLTCHALTNHPKSHAVWTQSSDLRLGLVEEVWRGNALVDSVDSEDFPRILSTVLAWCFYLGAA